MTLCDSLDEIWSIKNLYKFQPRKRTLTESLVKTERSDFFFKLRFIFILIQINFLKVSQIYNLISV